MTAGRDPHGSAPAAPDADPARDRDRDPAPDAEAHTAPDADAISATPPSDAVPTIDLDPDTPAVPIAAAATPVEAASLAARLAAAGIPVRTAAGERGAWPGSPGADVHRDAASVVFVPETMEDAARRVLAEPTTPADPAALDDASERVGDGDAEGAPRQRTRPLAATIALWCAAVMLGLTVVSILGMIVLSFL